MNELRKTLQVLLQIADEKRWCNKYEFQKNLTLLHSSHGWLIRNLSEKLTILKPLREKVIQLEDMITDCENQLIEISSSLSRCMKLKKLENIRKYEDKIEVRKLHLVVFVSGTELGMSVSLMKSVYILLMYTSPWSELYVILFYNFLKIFSVII